MNSHDPRHHDHTLGTARMRELFERASHRVDAAAANRLRRARRDALAPAPQRRLGAWIPAGAAMAAVLAVGVGWWLPERSTVVPSSVAQADAADPAWAVDDDADVYAWLGDAPVAIDSPKEGAL
jgi:hypothetical protein